MSNTNTLTFAEALSRFLDAINAATKHHAETEFENLGWSDDPEDTEAHFKPVTVTNGRKYLRVVSNNGQRSVYCFVNRETGGILKAATWKAPAKGERANIFDPSTYEGKTLEYGRWLYK